MMLRARQMILYSTLDKTKKMTDNNRNQKDKPLSPGLGREQNLDKEVEPASSQENSDDNPQSGTKWNNYRTRELADNESDDEASDKKE
jgi:hypothetical protein